MTSGVNYGYYLIVDRSDTTVTVNRQPPKYSDGANCSVYRPVEFYIEPDTSVDLTDTIVVDKTDNEALLDIAPGRIIVVNGQGYTISRIFEAKGQRVPSIAIVVDRKAVVSGLEDLSWRVPNTLVSTAQDFESLGVSTGDTLVVNVGVVGGAAVEIPLQVAGVDRNRLGFVLSYEPLVPGVTAPFPDELYVKISENLNIQEAKISMDGVLAITGTAQKIDQTIGSVYFASTYFNKELPADYTYPIAGVTFAIYPKFVIRNKLIPVSDTLRSVPALQE